MRVLVTGAAGFIGSHVAEMLVEGGHTVTGLDNFDPYYSVAQKRANQQRLAAVGVDVHEIDIRDVERLAALFESFRPDAVAHLAAKAGVRNSISHPREYFDVNLTGTQNIYEACREYAVGRVVFASTSSVYNGAASPFSEDFAAVKPLQPYAASKRSAELLASTYSTLYGVSTVVTRFFTVYGPAGRPDMMPHKLLRSAMDGESIERFDGDFWRDWTYVADIAAGVCGALAVDGVDFEILNLGRGEPQSLETFIGCVEHHCGSEANLKRVPAPASEMLETYADTSKARALLGFEPEVSIDEGVQQMIEWYRAVDHGQG